MRRFFISLLLSALIPALAWNALAESEGLTFFDTQLTNTLDYSDETWFRTSYNRALLSSLLALDLSFEWDDFDAGTFLVNSYVINIETGNMVLGRSGKAIVWIGYNATLDLGYYNVIENEIVSDSILEGAAKAVAENGSRRYYRNSLEDLMSIAELLFDD